jgi:energy-coupling factor transporter ATP-binding protein EcfA2
MKNSVSEEKEQDLRIERLSFTYEEPVIDLADWYDQEVPTDQTSAEKEATLKNISFSVKPGELILITGESGCGKTTLLQIINGIIPEFLNGKIEGDVLFHGESILGLPVDRRGVLTGSVFQNPRSQFFNVLVKDELRFGCENLNLPVEVIEKRISTLVKEFQLEPYLERNLFHLSGGEKQRVACLCVAAMQPPIMLYDEPSSNLDMTGMHSLAQLMQAFKQAGVTQLVAEHRLAYVSQLVDRVIFMKDGEIKECFSGNRLRCLSDEQLSQMGLRSSRASSITSIDRQLAIQTSGKQKSQAIIRNISPEDLYIESLEMTYAKTSQPLLRIKDYCFNANSIHALVAGNGMGKSTLLRSLAGLEKRAKGYIHYKNQRYKLRRMHRLCSVVFQDVNHQLLTDSVYNELLLSLDESDLQIQEKEEQIISLIKKLALDSYLDAHPFSLSGGQKQRLAFATALLMNRPILILDEPTSGLDLKHMVAMAEILTEYARDHLILLATHDQELLQLLNAEIHELVNF